MLDGGPSRKSRIAERHAADRPAVAYQRTEEPVTAESQPPVRGGVPSQYAIRHQERRKRPGLWWLIIGIVLAVGIAGWVVWSKPFDTIASSIDTGKHQAVFFASGQVYFGQLEVVNNDYMKLRKVFYIQSNTEGNDTQGEDPQSSTEAANMRLIKLGDEVHGPEDVMIINRDQILFFENLKPDSKVSQLIQDYISSNR